MPTFVRAAIIAILTVPMCLGIRANCKRAWHQKCTEVGTMTAAERASIRAFGRSAVLDAGHRG